MSRIKNYYFNDFNETNSSIDSIVDDFISMQNIKLPSNVELKKIERIITSNDIEEIDEILEESY